MGEKLKIMEEQKTGTVFIRTKKERNYTVMDNTFLRDERLSAQAKGVFAYILYLPEDWCIYQTELVKHFKNGKDALRSAIKELEEFGYVSKEHIKDKVSGRFTHWQYTINETPITPEADFPKLETPKLDNPPLLNTDNKINTNNTNICETNSSLPKLEDFLVSTKEKSTDVDLHTSKKRSSAKKSEQSFPEKDYSDCMSIYYKNRDELSKTQDVTSTIYNVKVYKKRLRQFFLQYGVEDTKRGISNSIRHSWIKKTDYSLNAVLAPTMFDDYIAGSKGSVHTQQYKNNKERGSFASEVYGKEQNWDIE